MNVQLDLPDAIIDEIVERVLARLPAHPPRTRLLPIREAADALGMTEAALRKHTQRGNIPTVRIGHRILIDLNTLE